MTEPEVPPTGESKSDLTVGGSATMSLQEQIEALLAEAHDYETTAEATAAAAVLAFNFAADRMGLTGFQASWAALETYRRVMRYEGPVAVFNGEDLLYPQYDLPGRLDKWIADCQPWLAEQARQKLDQHADEELVAPRVRAHWQKLAGSSAQPDLHVAAEPPERSGGPKVSER